MDGDDATEAIEKKNSIYYALLYTKTHTNRKENYSQYSR